MSSTTFAVVPPEYLRELAQLAKPTSTADFASIATFGLVSAAYLLKGILWDKPDPYHHLWFERPQLKDGNGTQCAVTTRNIAQKLEDLNKDVVIFWGSQSGTAEAFATSLARECHLRFGLETLSADLSDYDPDTIELIPRSKLAIFILSTFGEGDPSDNTASFWDWLLRSAQALNLPNLRYVPFGLGNSNYKYYNRVIDLVVNAFDGAGAHRLMPVGKADDAEGNTHEDFLAWKANLFTMFRKDLGFSERDVKYVPSIAVVEDESLSSIDIHHGEPLEQQKKGRIASSPIRPLAITHAHELFSSPNRNCMHMELDLSDHPELRYKTGDHIAIYPVNPDEEVHLLLRALGLEERVDTPILINPLISNSQVKLPSPTSTLALFRHYLEICAPVSRDTILNLLQFSPSAEAKALLLSLGNNKSAYANFVSENHVTIARLLTLAAPNTVWKDLPLSYLLEVISPIQPRYYSISSSSTISPRSTSITAVVDTRTIPTTRPIEIKGVTTNYLLSLSHTVNNASSSAPAACTKYSLPSPAPAVQGHKLFASLRRSKFKLPTLASTPLVMVAAGTGIAPFRAFVLERVRLKALGKPVGRMLLFFGCRDPEEDFLYRPELEDAVEKLDGQLTIITAFSRVDEQGRKRGYVQDRVREMRREVSELLVAEAGNLYICGRAAMARSVGSAVKGTLGKENGWGDEEAGQWSEAARKRGKWLEDVWG